MATGQFQTTFKPVPPAKGSFPLDRSGECKHLKQAFMKCLRKNGFDNSLCREESKNYLVCRMEKNLMQQETMSQLGYKDLEENNHSSTASQT